MISLKLPPLPEVSIGDHVRFSLVCFGEKRSATGFVIPPEHNIPNVILIEFKVVLPPISEIEEFYHSSYPPGGIFTGTVQIPLEEVEEVIGKQLDLLTTTLANGLTVRVECDLWDTELWEYQLGFYGAVSPTGYHSDFAFKKVDDLQKYVDRKAQEFFDEHLPKDVDGNPIFDADQCEVLRGKHKGYVGPINGCVFEGKMCFKDLSLGSFKPSTLRRVAQGQISVEILGHPKQTFTPNPDGFPVPTSEEAALVEAHRQIVADYWAAFKSATVVDLPPEPTYCSPQNRPIAKRHNRPGHASGWIEQREGNKQRNKPSISYFYCYEFQGVRQKLYIPVRKVPRVQALLCDSKPAAEILSLLGVNLNQDADLLSTSASV